MSQNLFLPWQDGLDAKAHIFTKQLVGSWAQGPGHYTHTPSLYWFSQPTYGGSPERDSDKSAKHHNHNDHHSPIGHVSICRVSGRKSRESSFQNGLWISGQASQNSPHSDSTS